MQAIEAWLELRRHEQRALALDPATSRQHRLELRRRAEALQVEADALRGHCVDGVHQPRLVRAVLVLRQPWLLDRLTDGLSRVGVQVAATTSDGARGCGIAIAEAPELVVLEAALPGMTGVDVTRRIRSCTPATIVAARVAHEQDRPGLLAAGAAIVWPRQVSPVGMLDDLAGLLQQADTA